MTGLHIKYKCKFSYHNAIQIYSNDILDAHKLT